MTFQERMRETMSETRYLISDAAKKVNVPAHVLRYWEEELEMEISRNEMGHRFYTDVQIRLFRQVKEWKEKEVSIGLIIIIILGAIALFLLIRREINVSKKEPIILEETYEQPETEVLEETVPDENVIVTETETEAETETKVDTETDKETENVLTNVQIITEETSKQFSEEEKKNFKLYDILENEKYTAATLTERKQDDDQLKELYEYWDAYKLDAVADLVRLERLQKVSKELEGKNKFYYYGSVDRLGRPSGKGLAVYEDNNYYFGDWKEGLRHGKGMWLEVAIYTEENENQNLGLIEHSYNGEWSRDLPNGQGQEHFSYNYDMLTEGTIDNMKCIANVIGGFKNGYYHGEMYIMTVDEKGNSKDWSGICKEGVWEPYQIGHTSDSVWESYEEDEQGNHQYHYLLPKENHNYGIIGLKK